MREWPTIVSDGPSHPLIRVTPAFEGRDLCAAAAGELIRAGREPIRGGSVDSRRVRAGQAFFALPGERTDGQRYLREAVAAGAAAVVLRDVPEPSELDALHAGGRVTIVRVADGLRALHGVAAAWRARFDPLVVGVTGSLAKTSTKEQIAEVLAERMMVLRNDGNENNEVGLPLTLLRLGPEHEAAVLEMGMYVPGDIALLAALARPLIGVVTAVRPTHLSRAGTIEAIERGKRELVEALPANGTAILNADDPRVARMRGHTPARAITYGFEPAADVRADEVRSLGEDGMRFALRLPDRAPLDVRTPALGRHSVQNALAAAAVGIAAGLDATSIVRGIGRGWRAPHRTQLVHAGGWRIVDDSYNASPDSMIAALELLATLPGRRIAVLGEMLELGPATQAGHGEVGRRAAGLVDALVTVGDGASGIAEGAAAAGMHAAALHRTADREAAIDLLLSELRPGDSVLVKASRGAELDRIVDALVAAAGEPVPG
jgi:UDP-N-acetylmuramoyl-tripeptide--D-alanyl-D-alanine ligase